MSHSRWKGGKVWVIFAHADSCRAAGDALKGVGHAILGWLVAFPFIAWSLALILQPIFTILQKRCESGYDLPHKNFSKGLVWNICSEHHECR
jgi:hypothetical protein